MRVVLVHPAGSNWVPGKKDVTVAANRMVPIGLLSIAAYLEKNNHEVFVHDCLGPNAPSGVNANVREVLKLEPDLVGFSCTTSGFLDAYDMATGIKTALPAAKNVFGGVHISGVGTSLMEQFENIDYLAIGEGEQTLRDLADARSPAEIDGLAWRDKGQIVENQPRTKIPSLDSLPFPAYHLLTGFPKGYRLPPFSYVRAPGTAMSTSRGCVYQCSYCDRSVFKKGFRSNSAEYTYSHMKYLKERFSIWHVNIYDDLFTTDKERISELCQKLTRDPLGIRIKRPEIS